MRDQFSLWKDNQPPATLHPRLAQAGPANQAARLRDPELEAFGAEVRISREQWHGEHCSGAARHPDSLRAQGSSSTHFQKAAKEFHFRLVSNLGQCQQSVSEEPKSRAQSWTNYQHKQPHPGTWQRRAPCLGGLDVLNGTASTEPRAQHVSLSIFSPPPNRCECITPRVPHHQEPGEARQKSRKLGELQPLAPWPGPQQLAQAPAPADPLRCFFVAHPNP